MKFDLNLILVFLEVYQHQSFTHASTAIGISQPGVSAAIKRMENELGEQLFVREGRKMKPTAMAIRLASRFQSGVNEIQNALTDRFSYTVYVSEALGFNLPAMDNILIEQAPTDQNKLITNLRNLSIDCAIGVFFTKDPSLVFEPILHDPTVVICRKDHPRIKNTISREAFYKEQHVRLSTTWNGMDAFELLCIEPVKKRTIAYNVSSLAGIIMQVSVSDNIAIISKHLAEKWKQPLGLQVIENPLNFRNIEYFLTYNKRYQKSASHQLMREQLKQSILTT